MSDMIDSIRQAEDSLAKRLAEELEKSTRDTNAELLERKRRQMYQEKKSDAVLRFEDAMTCSFNKSIQRGVMKTFCDVKKPIFNKKLTKKQIYKLSSYQLKLKFDQKAVTGKPVSKVKFGHNF